MASLSDLDRAKMLSMLKHDINNVLTGVKTGLDIMAMDDFFDDPDNAEDLNDVQKASKRLASMMEDLSLIFADLGLSGNTYPEKTIAEIQSAFQTECEQNRLFPIPKHDAPEGAVTIATPVLVRGLVYLTQALSDHTQHQMEYTITLQDNKLDICYHCPGFDEANLKGLIQTNDESRMSHILKMARQAVKGLKGRVSVRDDYLKCSVPTTT
jgi:signal transduction histidine kinase